MTVTVANTANTNTFDYWRTRTNELAYAMTTQAVTVNSNIATGNAGISGTFTSGNSTANSTVSPTAVTVSNTISSTSIDLTNIKVGNSSGNVTVNASSVQINNTLITNTSLKIGSSTANAIINSSSVVISNSTSNISFTVPTSAQWTGGNYYLNANGSWATIATVYNPASNGTITTSSTSTVNIDSFSTSTYLGAEYLVQANTSSAYHLTKLLVVHDGSTAYVTEYGSIIPSSSVGTFSATIASGNVAVQFTPASVSSTTLRYARVIV
jgi:hypothetical protein